MVESIERDGELRQVHHLVTQKEINAEAMCNPYNFLPLNIS